MSKLNSKADYFLMSYAPFKLLIVVYIIAGIENGTEVFIRLPVHTGSYNRIAN